MARFGPDDVERLLGDAGIVRHRGKIEATINNARRALELRRGGGLAGGVRLAFEPAPRGRDASAEAQHASTESTRAGEGAEAARLAFVGPTTVYAFMQAMGLVNDHLEACSVRRTAERARAAFSIPA